MKGDWQTWKAKALRFLRRSEHQIVIHWIPRFFRSVFKIPGRSQGTDSERSAEPWRELEDKVNQIRDCVLRLQSASQTYRGDLGKGEFPPSDLGKEGDLYESMDGRRFVKGPPFWEVKPGTYGVLGGTTTELQKDSEGRAIISLEVDIGGKVVDLGTLTFISPSSLQVAWRSRLGFDPELREIRDALFRGDLVVAMKGADGEEFVHTISPPPKGHSLYRGAPVDKVDVSSGFLKFRSDNIPLDTEIPFHLDGLHLGHVFVDAQQERLELRWSPVLPFETLVRRKELLRQHVLEYGNGTFMLSRTAAQIKPR